MKLRIEALPYDDPVVQDLVAAVQQEYVQRYGSPDEAVVDAAEFADPRGAFLVGFPEGTRAGVAVAMGGWRRLTGTTAELKRMYVRDLARRRGVARRMLTSLETSAAAAGVTQLVLNTGTEQPEAICLYESSGYGPVAPFGFYADAPLARFFGKSLVQSAQPDAESRGRTTTTRLE